MESLRLKSLSGSRSPADFSLGFTVPFSIPSLAISTSSVPSLPLKSLHLDAGHLTD